MELYLGAFYVLPSMILYCRKICADCSKLTKDCSNSANDCSK